MSNGNQKNVREQFPKSDIMPWDFQNNNVDGLKKEIEKLMRNFREFPPEPSEEANVSSQETNSSSSAPKNYPPYPCFFFKATDMYVLSNIPNFQGIRIYIGGKDADQLILVPVIKVNPYKEVHSQTFTTDGTSTTTSTVVALGSGGSPCPPYPNGMHSCP